MATKYVDSAATGSNDGTSWTDAWTSINNVTGLSNGDTVLIDDGHSEGPSANITFPGSSSSAAPMKYICVDKTDGSLSTGAVLTSNGANHVRIPENVFLYGLTLRTTYQLQIGYTGTNGVVVAENCTFNTYANQPYCDIRLGTGLIGLTVRLRNCTFDQSARTSHGWGSLILQGSVSVWVDNLTFTLPATVTAALFSATTSYYEGAHLQVDNSDLSGFSLLTALVNCDARFSRCSLKSGYSIASSYNPNVSVVLEQCAVGSLSVQPLGMQKGCKGGTVTADDTVYRTGGASDGDNTVSWKMATDTNVQEQFAALASPPVSIFATGGSSITITAYVASAGLNDDDFWMELSGPDDAGTPTAQGYCATSRMALQGTPASLTTDSVSTWNGTYGGSKQKVSLTYTPTLDGYITARFFLAKPSTNAWVDPKIEVA